ncbi:MAG: alpha/beta hydrolase [Alphaproteobacteria bacterium]
MSWLTWPMAGMVSSMHALQRSMMYVPHPILNSPAQAGVPEMAETRLRTSDGLSLVNWYRMPEEGRPTVVYCHGNAGNIATRAFKVRPFLDAGCGAILVGYRGYGGNPGSPSEEGLLEDATTAVRFLTDSGVTTNRMVFYGESLGSGVAVRLAADTRPGALVVESGFTSTVDVALGNYWYLPVRQMMADRFDCVEHISRVKAPVLLLHGEKDGVVPVDLGRKLFAAAREPKEAVFFPDGGHLDLPDHGSEHRIMDFVERTVGADAAAGALSRLAVEHRRHQAIEGHQHALRSVAGQEGEGDRGEGGLAGVYEQSSDQSQGGPQDESPPVADRRLARVGVLLDLFHAIPDDVAPRPKESEHHRKNRK